MKNMTRVLLCAVLLVLLPLFALADSSVIRMTAEDDTVTVLWESTEDALLVVEIVEDGESAPCESRYVPLTGGGGQHSTKVEFDDLPGYFTIQAYFTSAARSAGGSADNAVYTEKLYTQPFQDLLTSNGDEYKAEYGDRYVELFINEEGETSFGVLGEEYTVLRTGDLDGSVTIVDTVPDGGGEMTITVDTDSPGNAQWLARIEAMAEGDPVYLCIVNDKNRELLDFRTLDVNETADESGIVQYHLLYLGDAEVIDGGLRLTNVDEPWMKQRGVGIDTISYLLEKFNLLKVDYKWDVTGSIKDTFVGGKYRMQGGILALNLFDDDRNMDVYNDFEFTDLKYNGEPDAMITAPAILMNVPLKAFSFKLEAGVQITFREGENVHLDMYGCSVSTFGKSDMSTGVELYDVSFRDDKHQKIVMELGPQVMMGCSVAIVGAEISVNAAMKLSLERGTDGDDVMWHACGNQCVEGDVYSRKSMRLRGYVSYLFGKIVVLDVMPYKTDLEKLHDIYFSKAFGTQGDTLCPYKGYKTNVVVLDPWDQPVDIKQCSYAPVAKHMEAKASSSDGADVLYIPVSDTPVTVRAVVEAPDGSDVTLTQEYVKSGAAESQVVFRVEQGLCWLIFDDEGDESITGMPDAICCPIDEIFDLPAKKPVKGNEVFAGWSRQPSSVSDRQVYYEAGDIFWMSPEFVSDTNTVRLYPVWKDKSYLAYDVMVDESEIILAPQTGYNQTHISPVIPVRRNEDYFFVGWLTEDGALPHLPGTPNPYYPESGTLEAWWVDVSDAFPQITFDEGTHMDGKVFNMPDDLESGVVIGVPFNLPTNMPFLVDAEFWDVDIPQFFIGWSLFEDATIPTFFPGMEFVALKDTTLYAVWVDRPDFYMLSYDANGGHGAPRTYFNAKKISSTVPSRSGHVFKGWIRKADMDDDGQPMDGVTIHQPGDENPFFDWVTDAGTGVQTKQYKGGTLYAVWEESDGVYTLSFDANGGSGAPESVTGRKGDALTLPEQLPQPPADRAAGFAGWAESASAAEAQYQPGDRYTGTADATLYAVWTEDALNVYYDANGGDPDSVPDVQTFTAADADRRLSDMIPTRQGYRFDGWSEDPAAEYAQYQPGSAYEDTRSITLYAVWSIDASKTCVITYDANGGELAPEAQHAAVGQPCALSEQIPLREGYLFSGWSDQPSSAQPSSAQPSSARAASAQAAYQPGGTYTFVQDTTLYAVWTLDEQVTYTVAYDANGGDALSTPDAQHVLAGEPLTISEATPTRVLYTFLGWAEDAAAAEAAYHAGDKVVFAGDTTLYAVWASTPEKFYTVSYDVSGGDADTAPQAQSAFKGETLQLSTAIPIRENHVFMGWTDAEGIVYQPGDSYTGAVDVTLSAVWTVDADSIYIVTYDVNGGDRASCPPAGTVFKGEETTLSAVVPTRFAYLFTGWATEPAAAAAAYQAGDAFTPESDTTLYAVWQLNPRMQYTVIYHANGGVNAPETQTGIIGEAVTLSEQQPTREYYIFKGWSQSATATEAQLEGGRQYLVNGTITLYAVWETDPATAYTVTYHVNGGNEGTAPAQQLAAPGAALKLTTQQPVWDHGSFAGWAAEPNAWFADYNGGETIILNGNLDLYANWDVDLTHLYAVVYHANGGDEASVPEAAVAFYDVRLTLSGQIPVYDGHNFLGWAEQEDATEPAYQPGDTFPAEGVEPPFAWAQLYAVWQPIVKPAYTLTYDANGGSGAPEGVTVTEGETVYVTDVVPVCEASVFLGWALEADADAAACHAGDRIGITEDTTLYAVWEKDPAQMYVVTYDALGGSGAPDAQYVLLSQSTRVSQQQPVRENYLFKGWSLNSGAAAADYQPGDTVRFTGNVTLYAVWKYNGRTFTITYHVNGGDEGSQPPPQTAPEGAEVTLSAQTPTMTDYNFDGWATTPDALLAQFDAGETITLSSDLDLYALWWVDMDKLYGVLYVANGGDQTSVPDGHVAFIDERVTLSDKVPVWEDRVFLGWAESEDAAEPAYLPGDTYPKESVQPPFEHGVLYALWENSGEKTYTVTYHANGGEAAPASQTELNDRQLTLTAQTPVMANSRFMGWALTADAAEPAYQPGDLYPAAGDAPYTDATLYAVWDSSDRSYTVTYDPNGGTGAPEAQSAYVGSAVTLSALKPVREGYVFQGWAEDPRATEAVHLPGAAFPSGGDGALYQDTTLYAVWQLDAALMYTVSYDANGGTGAPDAQHARIGEELQLSAQEPVLDGRTFRGWALSQADAVADYQAGGTVSFTGSVTLYAVWEDIPLTTHTITYHANGGDDGTVPPPQTAAEGATVTLADQEPTKERYTFSGWSGQQDAERPQYGAGDTIVCSGDIDLYAVWEPDYDQMYAVLYDANGGSGAPDPSVGFNDMSIRIADQEPVWADRVFLGWALTKDATAAEYLPGSVYPADGTAAPFESVTLYAVWEEILPPVQYYTVTYDANGGTGVPEPQTEEATKQITLSDAVPVRDGYTFLGWALTDDATAAEYLSGSVYPADGTAAPFESVTLYAVWEEILPPVQYYTVTYDANGGTGVPEPQTEETTKQITLSDAVPVRDGYTFLGWALTDDATAAEYLPGSVYPADGTAAPYESVTLYAVWEEILPPVQYYTVTYDANGGTGAPEPQTEETTKQITLSDAVPVRDGYTFLGWALTDDATAADYLSGSAYPADDMVAPFESVTLYAVWEEILPPVQYYTVTYDANGGSGAPEPQTEETTKQITLSDAVPVRDGYTFLGWALTDDATVADYLSGSAYPADGTTAPYESVTMYAVWEEILPPVQYYTVTYDANGGSGAPEPQTALMGQPVAISAQCPVLDGYVFAGWTLTSDSTVVVYQPGQIYGGSRSITLYAVWVDEPMGDIDIPQTGDPAEPVAWAALLLLSGAGLIMMRKRRYL